MNRESFSPARARRPARACLAGVLALLLGACGGSGSDEPSSPGGPTQRAAALRQFEGAQACADAEQYIEDQAVAQMRAQIEAARDGKGGWGGWNPFFVRTTTGEVLTAAGDTTTTAAPTEFTTTNLRTAGVDEADIVKNDGTRIVALSGQRLHVVQSWPPEQMHGQGSLAIEGWPRELFLDGHDRAVVLSSVDTSYARIGFDAVICPLDGCGRDWVSRTKITEVDLADPAAPRVVRELYLPGRYSAARKIDRSVRLVLTDPLHYPADVRWFPAWDDKLWADPERLKAAWNQLIVDNERLIRAPALAAWLPAAQLGSGAQAQPLPHACTDLARVNAPTRQGLVTVATWQLGSGTLARSSVLAEGGTVYASARHLYVVTPRWWSWPEIGQTDQSYIHQFDITSPERAEYRASGMVEGTIGDAFALDEAASGHLRVVSTLLRRVPNPADPKDTWGRLETAARITVLEPRTDAGGALLAEVGRTPDMAPGERVMSSRILGSRGFVVTFRQVDPLFTVDLADPTAPKVLGELKVPGFSSYLHPIGENHLLGIGTYVPEPTPGAPVDWTDRGMQIAIFDVSDLARPRQTFVHRVGTVWGSSEAQWDHRAFTWLASRGLLALPYTSWEWQNGNWFDGRLRSEVQLYRVDAAQGITPLGALGLGDMAREHTGQDWRWIEQAYARRSIIADDWLYAVSDIGIRVAPIGELGKPAATAMFAADAAGGR